jgi:signal transduction histidine kinase
LQRDGPIALLLAMAALLVALQSAAQLALRRVNASLTRHEEELAAANQSLQEQIAQREEVEAALRQAQKMEAIGQLTGGVAHDFNNLLQVVLGSLERLRVRASRGGGRLDSDLDRLVEAAMQGGHRAATLTRRLLAFSRQQPLEPKQINVNKLVTGMSDMLSRTLGEAVKIEVILAGGLWRVMADENQLENALLNLAVNARDAMPGGGKLTIETANAHLDEAYARMETDVTAGQYVLLAVTDTGTGMPPEVLTKVFDTARQIRPDVKVLFTTGYARNAIVHDGRLDPGVELIGKPFSAIDLAFKIRAMLNR